MLNEEGDNLWTTSSVLVDYDNLNYSVFFIEQMHDSYDISKVKKHFYEENPFNFTEERKEHIWNWFNSYFLDSTELKYLEILSQMINSSYLSDKVKTELIFWISCVCDRVMADLTVNKIYRALKEGNREIEKKKLYEYTDKLTHLEKNDLEKAVNNYIDILKSCNIATYKRSSINVRKFKPSIITFAFALFYLFDQKQIPVNILRSYKFKYILLDINDVMEYLKILKKKEMIKFVVKKESFELSPKINFD